MEEKLLLQSYRKQIIDEIKGNENTQRKIVSYKKMNMQNDNFYQYVKEDLESKLDSETVKEMHIFANVNLQRRVSKNESSIYKSKPERSFYFNENEIEPMKEVYEDMDINTSLKRANEAYKYQEQCSMQIYPEGGKLNARVLLPHHYDVIPMPHNPEKAMAYIISNFDNTNRDRIRTKENTGHSQGNTYRDGVNQEIADYDDAQAEKERYYVWSSKFNFVMDGKGNILDKETESIKLDGFINEDGTINLDENVMSPLFEYECLPFIDIATAKDFEFWVRSGSSLYDACLKYNTILTSEFQVVELQGHSQAVYRGDANHMPENMRVGTDKVIFIPQDPDSTINSSFEFVNPNSDLGNIREFRESFLAAFLSSRGLDTTLVSGKSTVSKASSGIEKMLQMIEKFEASQEDFSLFKNVEHQLVTIIAKWIKSLSGVRENGELVLKDVYQINIPSPDDIDLTIEFAKPEMVKTELDELNIIEKEIEIGVSSRVHYLIENKGMTKEQAIERIKEIDEFETMEVTNNEANNITAENLTGI